MKGETIIMLEGGSIKGIKQRHRQLAERFARDNRVIYIDEPGNIITVFISKEKPLSNLWSWMAGLRKCEDGYEYWTPPPGLPFGYWMPGWNAWNHFWYKSWYRLICRDMPKDPIIFISNVMACKWLGFFREKFRIYDCCDEITGFYVPGLRPHVVHKVEDKLLAACDIVICSADNIYKAKTPKAKRTALVRNAGVVDQFKAALNRDQPRPKHLEGIDKPIVGFWGYLADWLDWEIVEYIIRNAPDMHFILIGPTAKGLSKHIDAKNVTYTGPLPHKLLSQYGAHFDCAILPFGFTIMTEHCNPVKMYEYLGAGLPVVATSIPEMSVAYGDFPYIADGGPAFLAAIRRAIEEDTPEKRQARADFAARENWDKRVDEIYAAVDPLLYGS